MEDTVYISIGQLEELLGKAFDQGRASYLEMKEAVVGEIFFSFVGSEEIPLADLENLIDPVIDRPPVRTIYTTTSGSSVWPYYNNTATNTTLDVGSLSVNQRYT